MSRDKQRLLQIMDSLDADYQSGKISEDKYRYFRSKYMAKLNNIEKQNRPLKHDIPKSMRNNPLKPKNEEEKLIEKYILNPKKPNKQDKTFKLKQKKKQPSQPMDKSTFKLALVLVLVIGFTAGIGIGVFGFDFGDLSIIHMDAVVTDTVFPDVPVVVTNITYNNTNTSTTSWNTTPYTPTPTPVNNT